MNIHYKLDIDFRLYQAFSLKTSTNLYILIYIILLCCILTLWSHFSWMRTVFAIDEKSKREICLGNTCNKKRKVYNNTWSISVLIRNYILNVSLRNTRNSTFIKQYKFSWNQQKSTDRIIQKLSTFSFCFIYEFYFNPIAQRNVYKCGRPLCLTNQVSILRQTLKLWISISFFPVMASRRTFYFVSESSQWYEIITAF